MLQNTVLAYKLLTYLVHGSRNGNAFLKVCAVVDVIWADLKDSA